MEFKDQMNNAIRLREYPRRIVSLVPSQTQLLFDLGLSDEVVGITKFCIYPDKWYRTKERIGGTKSVNIEAVRKLNPDLIIGNKEENLQADIELLKEIAPVWMSDIYTLDDALEMILSVGELVGHQEEAQNLNLEIVRNFDLLKTVVMESDSVGSVIYFIWNNPDMAAGKNTFINDLLIRCGFRNLITKDRYPEVSKNLSPDYVFLSSEPYPFAEKDIKKFENNFPDSKVVLIDGEAFSWYGSMLKKAPDYFMSLLDKLSSK